jgi:hypothetical protein
MQQFREDWNIMLNSPSRANQALEALFGEPVQRALVKQAQRLQEARKTNQLGIRSTGLISILAPSVTPIRSNTFHGDDR